MTCARRPAGARNPAPPTSAGSPRKADPRTGRARARLSLLVPVLALALGALSLLAPELAQAQETTAVSNHAQTKYDEYGTGKDVRAQGFTTGSVAGGYALTSIVTKFGPDTYNYTSSRMRAQVWSAAAGGGPGSKLADLEIPSRVWPGVPVSFTAPGTELKPSTKYYFVVYTTKTEHQNYMNFPVHVTQGKGEDSGGLAGWSIEDFSYRQHTDNAPTGAWRKNTTAVVQIRVNAAAAPSEPRNVKIVPGDDEVTLTWQVPTSWGSWTAVGYGFDLRGEGHDWAGAGLLSNPTATTYTIVRGIYRNLPEVGNGSDVEVRMYAYSQQPGTDGSTSSPFLFSDYVTTPTVRVGGPMAAPTGLTATPSARALALSWTAPAAGTAEALTGYDVHYTSAAKSKVDDDARASGRNAATAWVDANHTGTSASATIGGLAASKTYRVRVRGKNTHGGGPWVFGTGTTPAAWSALSITERNQKFIVSWTAPTGTWTGYDVHITSAPPWDLADNAAPSGTDHKKGWLVLNRGTETSPPTPSITILQLVNDRTYRVRVRAKTATSNSVWVFGSGTPDVPYVRFPARGQNVTEGATATVALSISYAIGSQSSINLHVDTEPSTADPTDYTSVPTSVTLPATGTSAEFSVVTTDDSVNEDHETLYVGMSQITNPPYGWNINSWPLQILDNDPPVEPTVLAVSGGLQSLTATWEKPAGPVEFYEVQIKEASAPDQTTTDTTPATGWDLVATLSKSPTEPAPTSVTLRGDLGDADNEYFLRHGTAYHVRVRANDGQEGTGNGYSDWSAPKTGTTAHARTPDAPRQFRAEPNNPGELRVSWWAPNRARDGGGFGTGGRFTDSELHYTSANETEVPDDAAASGTDPSVAWITATLRSSILSGLQGTRHRLRVRYHNRFGAGAWAYTTGTPQATFQVDPPTIKVPKPWVLPLNLRWEHPVPGLTPNGYYVHYTSAPKTGDGAVADDAFPVSGTDPAAGWVDAKPKGSPIATTEKGHNSWYAPPLTRGTEYRFRVRASYPHYVFRFRRPDRTSDWGHKTLVAGAGTAVGLFAFNAFESQGLASIRVNLANPVSHEVTVDYATSVPPTRAATPGLDYLEYYGSLTFAPGQTQWWLHVAITDDDIEDSGEQFVISLSNPRPANRVQLGSSSPGYGYHVHPLAASMTVTIYNHEADLSALGVETAPAEDGPWTALDFGLFSAGTLNYAVTVPHGTTHARLSATGLHDDQVLSAGVDWRLRALESGGTSRAIALEVGDNPLVVESWLPSGEQRTYTVTVTRQAEAPAAVAVNLSATPNPVAEGAAVTVTATLAEALAEAVTVPLTVTRGTSEDGDHGSLASIAIPAGLTSATGTITTSTDTDEDDETFTVALGTLPSSLTAGTTSSVEVTITDSGEQPAVPLTLSGLTGSTSTDGSTFGGTLNLGTFAAETTTYTATVAHAVTHVKLAPTASASGTTVQVGKGSSLAAVASGSASAAIALDVGANALKVRLSAADGRTRTYTVAVTREARVLSADATLSALIVEAGAAGSWSALGIGTFAAATTAYAAQVPHGTTHARLTATAAHAGATLEAGAAAALAAVASGTASPAIALAVGANPLAVRVTAENGTTKTYTVAVTRAAAPLTAAFENVPEEHTGEPFSFDLVLSDTPAAATAPVPASFRVSPGTASVSGSGRRYTVTVTPKPANAWKDVTVTLLQPADCTVAGAICTADGRALSNGPSRTVTGPVRIRVEGARAKEGRDASLDFAVTLHRAAAHEVSVDYATQDDTATAGADYTAVSGTLVFAGGETAKTVSVPVLDDAIDEGREIMRLLLSNPRGAFLRGMHTRARGIITNDDALQQAWLSRFGRTVGGHVTDAVSGRLEGGLTPGAHATLAGQAVDFSRTEDGQALAGVLTGLAQRFGEPGASASSDGDPFERSGFGGGPGSRASSLSPPTLGTASSPGQSITGRALLLGSAFHLAGAGGGSGPQLAAWGRVAHGRFDGEADSDAGRLRLDGEALTGTLGADADFGRALAGVAVSWSEGDGAFDDSGATTGAKGSVESTMTTVSPYARFAFTERVSAWGLAGLGTGDMTIAFDDGTQEVRTDLSMRLGALGARGELFRQDDAGGMDLALKADAFFVRMESEQAANSAATQADAHRLRLVLEGGRSFDMGGGASFRPSLELGLRHDGGDAETGAGLELGGAMAYADPATGLSLEARARMLLAHADSDYEEWGASAMARLDPGARGRGLSFSLSPTLGATSSASERLWGASDARALAPDGGAFDAARGLQAEAGYGMALFGDRFTGTPHLGFGLADGGARDWRIGWRLTSALPNDSGFEVSLDATRREAAGGATAPAHGVMLRGLLRW